MLIDLPDGPDQWWKDLGSCTANPDPFLEPIDVKSAIAICRTCPVILTCRAQADQYGYRDGVWGGVDRGSAR